jgi:hypothetical protein
MITNINTMEAKGMITEEEASVQRTKLLNRQAALLSGPTPGQLALMNLYAINSKPSYDPGLYQSTVNAQIQALGSYKAPVNCYSYPMGYGYGQTCY